MGRSSIGNYVMGKTIGEGSFSKVKIGYHRENHKKVAIKILNKKQIRQEEENVRLLREKRLAEIMKKSSAAIAAITSSPDTVVDETDIIGKMEKEVQLMMRLDHPNIVRVYEIFDEDEETFIIMEYASGGELLDHILAKGKLSEDEARRYFRQLISAIEHCHTAHVVHRDLKLENLLRNADNELLLSDFGLGRTFRNEDEDLMMTFCGTPNYAARELVKAQPYNGVKTDIWSLGVILFIMLTGGPPFKGKDIPTLYSKIKQTEYHAPSYLSADVKVTIAKMLTGDPKKRCTIEDLREDNWVNLGEKGPPLQVKPFLNSNETKPLIKRIVGVQVSPTGTSYTLHQVNDPRKLDASKTSRLTPVPRKNMSPLESCDQLGAISPISKARTASQNTADAPGEIINDANDYSGGLVLRKAIAKQTLRGRTVSSSVQTTNSKTVVSFRPRASSAGVARTQNILNRMSSQAFVSRLKTNSSAASLKISKQKENVSSNGSSGAPCPPYSQLDTNKRTKVFKSASFALDKHGNQKNNTNEPSPTNPVRNSIGNKSLGPDSLDPFSLQDEEEQCNPTVEEIESWHLFHRPAKKIRILKFAFNPATISSLSAPVIFQEMYKSLVHLQQEKYHGLVFKRDSDLYLISGRLMSKTFSLSSSSSVAVSKTTPSSSVSDETCRLQFEVEKQTALTSFFSKPSGSNTGGIDVSGSSSAPLPPPKAKSKPSAASKEKRKKQIIEDSDDDDDDDDVFVTTSKPPLPPSAVEVKKQSSSISPPVPVVKKEVQPLSFFSTSRIERKPKQSLSGSLIKSLAPHNTTASISSTASVAMHETASESKYFSADPNPTAVEDSDDDLMEMAPSVVDHQNTRKRAMQDIVNDHNGNDQVNDNEDDQLRMNKKVALEVTGEKKPSPVKYASPVKKQPSVSPTTLTKTTTPSFEQQQKNGTKDQQGNDIVTDEATDKKRNHYAAYLERKKNVPMSSALGSKEIPVGKPRCLLGLKFVFTGELSSITRDEASDVALKYAGSVTGAVSGKTTYLVAGDMPGDSKIAKAKSLNVKIINEDEFLDLIRTQPEKTVVEPPPKKPTLAATKAAAAVSSSSTSSLFTNIQRQSSSSSSYSHPTNSKSSTPASTSARPISELWTEKYRPKSYNEIIGNKAHVDKLVIWLKKWDPQRAPAKSGAASKDDITQYKAVLISGPPGIGKTTTAHLVARLEGWDAIELNASDTRSKKAIEENVTELTGSHIMTEYFTRESDPAKKGKSVAHNLRKKQVIIMDEVDGMSGGDRGGSTQLIALIKKTKVPIICICNDRQSAKVKSLANYCFDMRFRRPTDKQVEDRLKTITSCEGLQLESNVVHNLVQSTQADVRQILNLLSTYRLKSTSMSFDQSKHMMKSAEKNMTMTPFDAIGALLNASSYRSASLNDKMECYFCDFSLMPLMMQENYVRCTPQIAREISQGDPLRLQVETMNCLSNAADSLSDADLLDSKLRSSNNWSLLPAVGMFSTVRPAFFMHGSSSGIMYNFPQWLGQNSKQSKNFRLLKEIEAKMRTTLSGDKEQIREVYLPMITNLLTTPLQSRGKDGIDDVIKLMDNYYLSREDYDSILELGIGIMDKDKLMKEIPTAVKSAFTSSYNKTPHPLLFIASGTKSAGKVSGGSRDAVPDSLEAGDNEDYMEEEKESTENEEDDVGADKLIKAKKAKAAPKVKASSSKSSSSKGKGKK